MIDNRYQSDTLFLLIGTNPLPNYVSARLLARQNATVYLLHSDGADGPSTKPIAERLEERLNDLRPDLTIRLTGISDSNNVRITNALDPLLKTIAKQNPSLSVGLNYTGGTKPMSVHTHRLVKQVFPGAIFSYLDPRQICLRIDGQGPQSGVTPFFLAREAHLRAATETSLEELIVLHQYETTGDQDRAEWALPEQTPGMIDLCQAIAAIWANKDALEQWRRWIHTEKFTTLPDPSRYPNLQDIRNKMDAICGDRECATPDALGRLLRPHDPGATLISCSKWFIGAWLEDLVPNCIRQVAATLKIKSVHLRRKYRSTVAGSDSFELDSAFMLGYQMFAISCIATENKEKAKEHLFEAYVRARQLGGDEARVGLVCCMDGTEALRNEIERTWDAKGKIWVFGRNQLADLSDALKEWIKVSNP